MTYIRIVETIALTVAILSLSLFDIRERRMPSVVTMPLIVCGLIVECESYAALLAAICGSFLGFTLVYGIAFGFRQLHGRDGIGSGDARLLAAAGAWLGGIWLAPILLIGSVTGLLFAGVLRLRGNPITMTSAIPFGPFLSIGFFTCWCLKISGVTWFG